MARCAFVSFRLGMTDGVSVVADTWMRAMIDLGWDIVTVAGDGPVDRRVPGLAIHAETGPDRAMLESALDDVDLVVVENLLTIPLNLPASLTLAAVLGGRPAVMHHHDPPWQRARFEHVDQLPIDDPAWAHVTINRLTERQFAERGLAATTIYNGFDTNPSPGDAESMRELLHLNDGDRQRPLLLHPVRAIARKNIPAALAVTEAVDGVYWLPGPAEEDYGPELERLLDSTDARFVTTPIGPAHGSSMADAYAACDLVLFPSTWEGFGNPPIEAALYRRPVVVGDYPVAAELRELGFRWLDPTDTAGIAVALNQPDDDMLATNHELAVTHFSFTHMATRLESLLVDRGWTP